MKQDVELATKGISNPWDKYPKGCATTYLHAWSRLEVSDDKAVIGWHNDSARTTSDTMLEKHADLESSGVTLVRENDLLTEVLGTPE